MTAIEDHPDPTLEMLRAAIATVDPVPAGLVAMARESLTWRTIDAELAALVFDSAVDEVVGVRSALGPGAAEQVRSMSFETATGAIELEADIARGRVVGQVVPARSSPIELRHPGGTIVDRSDDLGRFRFEGVPRGPVRITVVGEPAAITTEWFVL
jgi:hypothetical protein